MSIPDLKTDRKLRHSPVIIQQGISYVFRQAGIFSSHNTAPSVFKPIDEIRLEYHLGPKEQLFSALKKNGYNISFLENGKSAATVWCAKRTVS